MPWTPSGSSRISRFLPAVILAALLIICLLAWLYTREADTSRLGSAHPAASPGAAASALIDDKLLQTAQRLASSAGTAGEQELAREALRLADHELDQAFAMALTSASAPSPPATPELKRLTERIARIQTWIDKQQDAIARLSKQTPASGDGSDQLAVAKARLSLGQDELDDARQDLDRQGGDRHSELERLLQLHEAAQHQSAPPAKTGASGPPATLYGQISYGLGLRRHANEVQEARLQAENHAAAQARLHDALEKAIGNQTGMATSTSPTGEATAEDSPALVAQLSHLSGRIRTLAQFDKRIQDSRQLADVYRRWGALLDSTSRAALHALLTSLCWILTILLVAVVANLAIYRAFGAQGDRRRMRQLRVIATIATQLTGAVLIFFVVFGPPSQLSTIIGLATAGVTVVMRDFIVAFFGWFVLMGKNGIHVGDWVEIEGVGGEVVEIGLLRTVLLEVGNWTDRGHPTGRGVAFVNSFAIEGHYFNFSTSDQWLWDQLTVSLPAGADSYQMAQRILETVQQATGPDAALAEQAWQRVTRKYGARMFSAKPAVDIRPSSTGAGMDVHVRYITRAPQRYEMKSRLFEAVVELLHKA